MRLLAAGLAGVVLVVGVSACTPRPAHPARGPGLEPVQSVRVTTGLELPLDAYYPTAEQDLTIQRAEGVLTARCMARNGREYRPREPFHFDLRAARARLFGIVDERDARTYGYAGHVAPEPKPEPEAKLDAAAEKALTACFGEASRAVGRNATPISLAALDDLIAGVSQLAESDERVQGKFREWSTCMKANGFAYADPWQPNDSPRWKPGKPTALEKRTAVADVRCKQSTGLVDTWYAVLVEHQRRAIEQYGAQLDRLTKSTAVRAENAERVLAG